VSFSPGPSPSPSLGTTISATAPLLKQALLPAQVLSSVAIVSSKGTDLSQISELCGAPVNGATATAYEDINDNQNGQFLVETLTAWDSTADASQSIVDARQAVDRSGNCSVTTSGVTQQFTGDYAGSPPSACVNAGQYLASMASASSSSSFSLFQGYIVAVQCGLITITVKVESNTFITQDTADGYLSSAAGQLASTIKYALGH
jgi:hypothetical protein